MLAPTLVTLNPILGDQMNPKIGVIFPLLLFSLLKHMSHNEVSFRPSESKCLKELQELKDLPTLALGKSRETTKASGKEIQSGPSTLSAPSNPSRHLV